MNQYLYADYFKNVDVMSISSIVGLPISLFIAAVIVKISAKFGKKEVCVVGILFAGAIYLVTFIMKTTNPWIFLIMNSIALFGITAFNMLIWANITDIIDYNEVLTGKRNDGAIYGLYSFSRKIGQALAGGLGGFALSFIGYNSLAAAQTTQVTDGIYTIATIFPAICYIIVGLIFIFAYPLNKNAVKANAAKLASIRNLKK